MSLKLLCWALGGLHPKFPCFLYHLGQNTDSRKPGLLVSHLFLQTENLGQEELLVVSSPRLTIYDGTKKRVFRQRRDSLTLFYHIEVPDLLHSPDANANDTSCPRLLQAFPIDMRCGGWGPQRPSAHAVPLQRNPWRPWLRRRHDQPKAIRQVGDSDNIGISDTAPTPLPTSPTPHPQSD